MILIFLRSLRLYMPAMMATDNGECGVFVRRIAWPEKCTLGRPTGARGLRSLPESSPFGGNNNNNNNVKHGQSTV